ncbi:AI-2E family transporter [soil metagenome]
MTRDPIPRWLVALLFAGAVIVSLPFAPWVVLAIWLGLYARKIHGPLTRALRGRSGLAATLTVLLALVIVIPVALLTASVVIDAIALVQQLLASDQAQNVLERLAGSGDDSTKHSLTSIEGLTDLLMSQGERAWAILRQVAGAAAHVVIGLLIFVSGIYGVLTEGNGWWAWIKQHAPMQPRSIDRFADAFVETGRGMAYGVVGAGLIQSVVATIAFLVLGVPSAFALGMLTLMFSVIPAIGTAIVWVPVAAGLALMGRTGAAIALAAIGVLVIGSVDNLARPFLAKRGNLQLPTYVVLIAMFGGIELLGGWGLILGPLIVRLAKEAILIRSEAVASAEAP